MKKLLTYTLTLFIALAAFGQNPADSTRVYFRVGYSQFDPSFDDNAASMDSFIAAVRMAKEANDLDSIVIRAYTSPEGRSNMNERLSRDRCNTIARYIIDHADIHPDLIAKYPEGEAWGELRRIVVENPDVPSREKVLDILDNVPLWVFDSKGAVVDGKKKRLMDLDHGKPYAWLYANVFPQLRNATAIALYIKRGSVSDLNETVGSTDSVSDPSFGSSDSLGLSAVTVHDQADLTDETRQSDAINPHDSADVSAQVVRSIQPKAHYFALKTNMLYDAALVPNIGAEFYLGKNLSLYGQWMYAWWNKNSRHRYWRIYGGDLGLRWWFGSKAAEKPLSGHHLGVYGGILTFDFEFGDTGYMGGKPGGTLWDRCIVNAGIEYGYSLPVSNRLNIDFSIGLGYLSGNYIKYFPFDNDYYRKKEYRLRFFGPTKAEVSLVWLLGHGNTNKRKGGGK